MSDPASLDPALLKLLRAYDGVFRDHPAGRIVLADLLGAGGLLTVGHIAGDAQSAVYADGRRSLALHVLERLRWSEAELIQLAMRQGDADWDPIGPSAGLTRPEGDDDDHMTLGEL